MKKIIALVSFMISMTAFAAGKKGYELRIDLSVNGKHLEAMQIQAEENRNASVTFQQKPSAPTFFVDVVTSEHTKVKKGGILMKFVVGRVNADGTRTTLASPQVITLENNQAQIIASNNDNSQSVSIQVTPKRITIK